MTEPEYESFDIATLSPKLRHEYLLSSVAPRPIAWASTISKEGVHNLAPFSFFNIFSSSPPIVVFSPSRRVRDNTIKHTLINVQDVPEVVINIVSYDQLGEMVLSSAEYPDGVEEWEQVGLQAQESITVKPRRVANAPAQLECKVINVIPLGETGGSGNLVICEVQHLHLRKDVFTDEGRIDPYKMDTVARMGGLWYSRAIGHAFEVRNPTGHTHLGSTIPEIWLKSTVLTGSDLSLLATIAYRPEADNIEGKKLVLVQDAAVSQALEAQTKGDTTPLHQLAQQYIRNNELEKAWDLLTVFS